MTERIHAFFRDRLVPDWRDAWRWFSVWIGGVYGLLLAAFMADPDWPLRLGFYLPPEFRALFPPWIWFVLPVVSVGGRLLKQRKAK